MKPNSQRDPKEPFVLSGTSIEQPPVGGEAHEHGVGRRAVLAASAGSTLLLAAGIGIGIGAGEQNNHSSQSVPQTPNQTSQSPSSPRATESKPSPERDASNAEAKKVKDEIDKTALIGLDIFDRAVKKGYFEKDGKSTLGKILGAPSSSVSHMSVGKKVKVGNNTSWIDISIGAGKDDVFNGVTISFATEDGREDGPKDNDYTFTQVTFDLSPEVEKAVLSGKMTVMDVMNSLRDKKSATPVGVMGYSRMNHDDVRAGMNLWSEGAAVATARNDETWKLVTSVEVGFAAKAQETRNVFGDIRGGVLGNFPI